MRISIVLRRARTMPSLFVADLSIDATRRLAFYRCLALQSMTIPKRMRNLQLFQSLRCRNAARERIDGSIGDRRYTSTSSTYVATLSLCFSVPSDCCTMALRNTMDRPLNFSDRIKDRSVGERTIITIERDSIEFLFPDGFQIFFGFR